MPSQKGFTLVELLVVVVLISILGLIIIAALKPDVLIRKTKDTVSKHYLETFGYVVNSLHSADGSFPTKTNLLSSLIKTTDAGSHYFSYPVRPEATADFSYVVADDGSVACLSTPTDDGRNLLWCSNAGDIRDSTTDWCYPKDDGHGNFLAGDC